jgi:hypothetical protein
VVMYLGVLMAGGSRRGPLRLCISQVLHLWVCFEP